MPFKFLIISFLLSVSLTPVVRKIAIRYGWVSRPSEDRWHRNTVANFGGIAIYLGLSLPLMYLADFSTFMRPFIADAPQQLVSISAIAPVMWIGITILFILGAVDDFIQIKPQTKFVGQILVASMVTFFGLRFHWFGSPILDILITLFWIVGLTNAYNLLDNMDGLCAGTGLIVAGCLALLLSGPCPEAAIIALMVAGSLTGFLMYNFNPASIFMGDCGSMVIGFSVSVLSLCFFDSKPVNSVAFYAVPVLLHAVAIFDTSLVTIIRTLSGRKASTGGKDHTSHRLVLMGFSEKQAVIYLYAISCISGIAAVFISRTDTLTSPVVIIPVAFSILLMGIYLAQLRVYPEKEFGLLRDRPYTPILANLMYKRQLALVVLDFCLITFSYYFAYRLRFDATEFPKYFNIFLKSLPAVIACKFAAYYVTGIYRGMMGRVSSTDLFVYLKASTLGAILSVAAVTYFFRFQDFSKGIFIIDWLLTMFLLTGTRGSFRLFSESVQRRSKNGHRVLIYGAGRGGELLVREILNNGNLALKPIGFIDDDRLKQKKKLQGLTVLGTFGDLNRIVETHSVEGLVLSFTRSNEARMEELKKYCKDNNLFLKQFAIGFDDVDLREEITFIPDKDYKN